MRSLQPPFRYDIRSLLRQAQRLPQHIDGVSINLPFVTIAVQPDNTEQTVAREIVIRLANKRVLNASECCDGCIQNAIDSLQDIRALLVEKQVELSDQTDGPLFLLIEIMLEAIRQFLTYEERLTSTLWDRENYFAALEMLRAHLYRSLSQVAAIAAVDIPSIPQHMRYDPFWQLEAYVDLAPTED